MRPEVNENIWNSLLLFKRLPFFRELPYIQINVLSNTLTVQTAKNHKESPFLHILKNKLMTTRENQQLHSALLLKDDQKAESVCSFIC